MFFTFFIAKIALPLLFDLFNGMLSCASEMKLD